MKKIVSLGIAASMLAATAAVVSAADVTTIAVAASETAVKAGDKVTITVTAEKGGLAAIFGLKVTGLTIDSKTAGSGLTNLDGDIMSIFDASGKNLADGQVVLTVTATVTDPATAKVELVVDAADAGATAVSATNGSVAFTKAAEESSKEESSSTEESSKEESSSTEESSKEESSDSKGEGEGEGNVNTGVALAVIPVALAAAGVIVAKKKRG